MTETSDPTLLTTVAIARDVAALRELLEIRIEALRCQMQAQVEGHWTLDAERFRAVETRFGERDLRFKQAESDAAAITERLGMLFTKQIDSIGDRLDRQISGMSDRVTDLKDRVINVEGLRTGSNGVIGWIIGATGAFVAIVTGLITATHVLWPQGH